MEGLAELQAREDELTREWHWLHDTLNKVARVRAEQGDTHAFRLLQAQAMAVGQRRIELSVRIAHMQGPHKVSRGYARGTCRSPTWRIGAVGET